MAMGSVPIVVCQGPLPVAVALICSKVGSFTVGGASEALDVEVHYSVDGEHHHFPEEICVRALLNEFGKVQSVDGHGVSPVWLVSQNPNQAAIRTMTAPLRGCGQWGLRAWCPYPGAVGLGLCTARSAHNP